MFIVVKDMWMVLDQGEQRLVFLLQNVPNSRRPLSFSHSQGLGSTKPASAFVVFT